MEKTPNSPHRSTVIIAETAFNHHGDLHLACKMIEEAAKAGVDYVKFRTFVPERVASGRSTGALHFLAKEQVTADEVFLPKYSLSQADHFELLTCCHQNGVRFLSTPFDEESLTFLVDECGVDLVKIGSSELTNAPLLVKAGMTKKKILLSTGMSTVDEVFLALSAIAFGFHLQRAPKNYKELEGMFRPQELGEILCPHVSLLHCTVGFPASYNEISLSAIHMLQQHFGLPVGYSDHTQGVEVALAAVALGACVIKKHYTLDRSLQGSYDQMALEPEEFKHMIRAIRNIESALGRPYKRPTATELMNLSEARKSLVAARKICQGDAFRSEDLAVKRPAIGISPFLYWDYLGKQAEKDYEEDELI